MTPDNSEPKRERWNGQVSELPYKTEDFDGGECVELTYTTVDGQEKTTTGEIGEYMSHNSWLMIFGEDQSPESRVPDFIIRRDGVVMIDLMGTKEKYQVGRCVSVESITNQSGFSFTNN